MTTRMLNREVPPFDRVVPTTENIAIDIWRRLETPLNAAGNAKLYSVRVHETPDFCAEYRGEA